MATKMIGLDLGLRQVRACEMVAHFSATEPKALYQMPVHRSDNESLLYAQLRAVKNMLSIHEMNDVVLACALPRQLTSTMVLTIPFDKPSLIEEVLPGFIDERVPLDVEDLVYDVQVTQQGEGETELLVAYTTKEAFDLCYATFLEVGLDPKILTLGGLSFINLVSDGLLQDEDDSIAILDLGEQGSEWVIISEGKVKLLQRSDVGGREITRALARTFKVDDAGAELGKLKEAALLSSVNRSALDDPRTRARAEAIHEAVLKGLNPITRDLQRTLGLYERQHKKEISTLYIVGGGAQLKGLNEHLSERLGIPVQRLPAPKELMVMSSNTTQGSALSEHLAYALSSALCERAASWMINFRKGEYAYKGDFNFWRSSLIRIAIVASICLSLQGLSGYLEYMMAQEEMVALEAEVEALGERLIGTSGVELDTIKYKVTHLEGTGAKIPEISVLDTFGELSKEIEKSVEVELDVLNITLTPGGRGQLSLRGKTQTVGDVSQIIAALEKTSCFSNKVKKDKVTKSVDGRTTFRISASSSCK